MSNSSERENADGEIAALKQRLQDAEDLCEAISLGAVDALVVGPSDEGKSVLMLSGAYARYRQLVEQMRQGAVTIDRKGEILYANQSFADLLKVSLASVFRAVLHRHVHAFSQKGLDDLLSPLSRVHDVEVILVRSDGGKLPARLSLVTSSNDFLTLIVTDLSQGEGSREAQDAALTIRALRDEVADSFPVGVDPKSRADELLGSILAAVKSLKRAGLDPEQRRLLELLDRDTGTLAGVIAKLDPRGE